MLLTNVLVYIQFNERVCPNPQRWNKLWEMLPDRHRIDAGWEPPLPLFLAAWWHTPMLAKMSRLRQHLRYAERHGVLDRVDAFLRVLPESEWAHASDFEDRGRSFSRFPERLQL